MTTTDEQATSRVIAEDTGNIGAAFYFHPATLAHGKELGLDGFRFYVLGRGGALGDVTSGVIRSAFGYFELGLVEKMWGSAKEVVEPRTAAQAYWNECGARGRELFADLDAAVLDAYNDAAQAVIDAQPRGGLPLFAATTDLVKAEDAPALAMQNAAVLREMRGSAHLCGVLASGLTEAQAHCYRRPDMVQGFGYSEAPELPDDIDDRLAEAERITDVIVGVGFGALSPAQHAALLAGTEAMAAALAR